MKLLIIFILLNIANVIIQTVKSLVTVKAGKYVAAIVNAVAYGLYTVVTVFLMCDLNLGLKATIVALCNLVGVFVVKHIEEKTRKAKLWKVETNILKEYKEDVATLLEKADIPYKDIDTVGKYVTFNIFCSTEKQSSAVKEILKTYRAKYFVSESKTL